MRWGMPGSRKKKRDSGGNKTEQAVIHLPTENLQDFISCVVIPKSRKKKNGQDVHLQTQTLDTTIMYKIQNCC